MRNAGKSSDELEALNLIVAVNPGEKAMANGPGGRVRAISNTVEGLDFWRAGVRS